MESLEVWPTHIGIHHYEMASNVNPLFRKIFHTMRVTDDYNSQNNPFYASRDDLLNRVKLNEWADFVNFAVAAIRDSAKLANVGVWPEESVDLQIEIKGIWFQIRTVAYTMISIPMETARGLPFTLWTLMSTSGGFRTQAMEL